MVVLSVTGQAYTGFTFRGVGSYHDVVSGESGEPDLYILSFFSLLEQSVFRVPCIALSDLFFLPTKSP